jgi:hypothetical protein
MTPIIAEYRGITAPPIEVSSLFTSPAAVKLKEQGKLVGDQQVMELLFEALLKPEYATGVVVDGFPRTKEQAECIKYLYGLDHRAALAAPSACVHSLLEGCSVLTVAAASAWLGGCGRGALQITCWRCELSLRAHSMHRDSDDLFFTSLCCTWTC